MNWYKRACLEMDVVEAAKSANPGPEHQRLEAILWTIAKDSGFVENFDFPTAVGHDLVPPPGPEISMRHAGAVFLADAKDARNETADRDDSRRRIFRYIRGLAKLLHNRHGADGSLHDRHQQPASRCWVGGATEPYGCVR